VSYLNTRPLVRGLDRQTDLFTLRFDVPSLCATLLHDGRVDLGLIPAIEYLRHSYAVVPDVAIGSDGPVESVALFSRVPLARVRTLALDASSRTSVALTRILCARLWDIAPRFRIGAWPSTSATWLIGRSWPSTM
jgi:chorismate dehydratase